MSPHLAAPPKQGDKMGNDKALTTTEIVEQSVDQAINGDKVLGIPELPAVPK
jgi:hypothetical protein